MMADQTGKTKLKYSWNGFHLASLTFAEAVPACFPPEPEWFHSLAHSLANLLFSSFNNLFSSNNIFT